MSCSRGSWADRSLRYLRRSGLRLPVDGSVIDSCRLIASGRNFSGLVRTTDPFRKTARRQIAIHMCEFVGKQLLPSAVCGAYWPGPKTISEPNVYARAPISCADCAASEPVWMRTPDALSRVAGASPGCGVRSPEHRIATAREEIGAHREHAGWPKMSARTSRTFACQQAWVNEQIAGEPWFRRYGSVQLLSQFFSEIGRVLARCWALPGGVLPALFTFPFASHRANHLVR